MKKILLSLFLWFNVSLGYSQTNTNYYHLAWDAAIVDADVTILGYRLYISTNLANFTKVGEVGSNTLDFYLDKTNINFTPSVNNYVFATTHATINQTNDAESDFSNSVLFKKLNNIKKFAFVLPPPPPNTNTLVAWWTMDSADIIGTTVLDKTGNGHDGTLVNSPAIVTGKFGQALSFNGINTRLDIGDVGTNAYSISFWMNFPNDITGLSSAMSIFKYGDCLNGPNEQMDFVLGDASGYVDNETLLLQGIANCNDGNTIQRTAITANIFSGWHLIVLVWNGSNYDFYIDSLQVQTTSGIAPNGNVGLINLSGFTIGYGLSAGASYFNGLIDDVRIYSEPISITKIQQIYNGN